MPPSNSDKERKPKTELDEQFLLIARRVMQTRGIKSDRAISLALGRHSDFINRVSKGLQSATPEAWDKLLTDYPEARTTTNVMAQGGQAIGTNNGTATQHGAPLPQDGEREDYRTKYESAQKEIALLTSQLADKERTIQILLNQLPK